MVKGSLTGDTSDRDGFFALPDNYNCLCMLLLAI